MNRSIQVRLPKVEHQKMGLARALADVISASVQLAECKRRLCEVASGLDFECGSRSIRPPLKRGQGFSLRVSRDGQVSVLGLDLSYPLSSNAKSEVS